MEGGLLQDLDEALAELDGIVDRLLTAAEEGSEALQSGSPGLPRAREAFGAVTSACVGHDLVRQRLMRLKAALAGVEETRPDADLLAGPAPLGGGLGQHAADRLLDA